ncbi:Auxin response factor 3 [Zea mays]|nr:Auxin response factor 3 [Zea mays]
MFQRGDPKMSPFEFGHFHVNKKEDRRAMFVHAGGIGGTEQTTMLQAHHVSGGTGNRDVTVEKSHPAVAAASDNREVSKNSCKIFGISLTEKVPAMKEKGCGDINTNYPSPFLSLKQQVPKSLGNSCATVHEQRPVVARVIDVSTVDMMI